MRQIVSMLLVAIVAANVIANLPETMSLISQALFTDFYHQDEGTGEGIHLNSDAPDPKGAITLEAAPETIQPFCSANRQSASGWPGDQESPLGFGDIDVSAPGYGQVIPDDPPRYKLDLPDYDQFQIVLWASDSAPQTPVLDAPGHMCTGQIPVRKIKQDSC